MTRATRKKPGNEKLNIYVVSHQGAPVGVFLTEEAASAHTESLEDSNITSFEVEADSKTATTQPTDEELLTVEFYEKRFSLNDSTLSALNAFITRLKAQG